ncbi:zinc-binding dehydrogenase [Saccharopolyspora sp. 5N102]|uniref:zinc-binding dehydrogenase n=1 Tax=Saccharopolyspora sp. 5N102 TaxID=3375155 RepID=UPI0037AAE38D
MLVAAMMAPCGYGVPTTAYPDHRAVPPRPPTWQPGPTCSSDQPAIAVYAKARPGYLRGQWTEILPKLESGALAPPVGGSYAVDDVRDALEAIDRRQALGKLVLRPGVSRSACRRSTVLRSLRVVPIRLG